MSAGTESGTKMEPIRRHPGAYFHHPRSEPLCDKAATNPRKSHDASVLSLCCNQKKGQAKPNVQTDKRSRKLLLDVARGEMVCLMGPSGTGLGLALVAELTEAMGGGRVEVESTIRQGSCLTVTLPRNHA